MVCGRCIRYMENVFCNGNNIKFLFVWNWLRGFKHQMQYAKCDAVQSSRPTILIDFCMHCVQQRVNILIDMFVQLSRCRCVDGGKAPSIQSALTTKLYIFAVLLPYTPQSTQLSGLRLSFCVDWRLWLTTRTIHIYRFACYYYHFFSLSLSLHSVATPSRRFPSLQLHYPVSVRLMPIDMLLLFRYMHNSAHLITKLNWTWAIIAMQCTLSMTKANKN